MLEVKNVSKIYKGKNPYPALSHVNLFIQEGEFIGMMGPSGSGKTTFLNVISTIDKPTSGEVLFDGTNMYAGNKHQLSLFRRRELGFVFQDYNLLQTLTVKENMIFPLTLANVPIIEQERRVGQIAEKLGIGSIMDKRTYEISGGQCQRTAIARAIIHQPKLLLADEPTGNLDSKSAKDVLTMMSKINQEDNTTMLMVTHDALAASYCDRVVFIKDGCVYRELYKQQQRHIFYREIMDVLSTLGGAEDELSSIRM